MTDMHNSVLSSVMNPCGHGMHSKCFREYIKTNIACPLCKKSLIDMSKAETFYDQQIAANKMPREFRYCWMKIICNDCLH